MTLIDDGKLRLDDSVEPWLPELANRRVLRSIDSELTDTVTADRSITIRDLLTFCMGFGSVMAMPGTYPIQQPIRDGRLGGDGPPHPRLTPGPDEWMRRLGALPLMYQPGERWAYNTGSDVLGVLISRVVGKPFEVFLRERLFDPLGMKDTSFSVPASNIHRLPDLYQFNHDRSDFDVFDSATNSEWSTHAAHLSSGRRRTGISPSTTISRSAGCLLNGGVWDGERILTQTSIEAMTSNQITPEQKAGAEIFFPANHSSWGFRCGSEHQSGKALDGTGTIWLERRIWHFGLFRTPANDFIGIILMTQRMMESTRPTGRVQRLLGVCLSRGRNLIGSRSLVNSNWLARALLLIPVSSEAICSIAICDLLNNVRNIVLRDRVLLLLRKNNDVGARERAGSNKGYASL